MSGPSTTITRFDLSLSYSEFSLRMNRKGFIGHKVFPPLLVGQQSGDFLRVNIASLLGEVEDTERPPRGEYKTDDYEWTKDSYATEDHGAKEILDHRQIKRWGNEIRAEQIHRNRAVDRVLRAYESAVATAVFNTTVWTGATLATAAGTVWSTKASATPIANLQAAAQKVVNLTGRRPNTAIMTYEAFEAAMFTDEVTGLIKYSGSTDPKELVRQGQQILAAILNFDQVLVANAFTNTANRGLSATTAALWDRTMAMVAHVHAGPDLEEPEPNVGRTIMWQEENGPIAGDGGDDGLPGIIIEEEPMSSRRTGIVARNDRQVKRIHTEAAHLITGVLS